MKVVVYLLLMGTVCFSPVSLSQCTGGSIGVTGAGCGCLSGCNLTSFGGPNCGSGTSGNCNGGYRNMHTDIIVPEGCRFTVTATMRNRPGCSASGADGNCQTCDVVKVDVIGGGKLFQQGGSNSSLTDSYTLNGPGTIRVSGRANRADEIITYTITSTSTGGDWACPNCVNNLPIELIDFKATANLESVDLTWSTATEKNNDYFTIERSKDGLEFEPIHVQGGQGNSTTVFHYKTMDYSPLYGRSYYRLKQTDYDGRSSYSQIETVFFEARDFMEVYPNPAQNQLFIRGRTISETEITISNSLGQTIDLVPHFENNELIYSISQLQRGTYFVKGVFMESVLVKKVVVN